MKYNLLFLVILITASLSGQGRFSLETFGGYGISNSPNSFLQDRGITQDIVQVGRFGLGGSYSVSGGFLLRTGIQLTDYGFVFGEEFVGLDGNGQLFTTDGRIESFDRTLELLMLARYELPTNRKLVPYLEGGFVLNNYLNTRRGPDREVPLTNLDESPFQEPSARRFNAAARVGAGANLQLSDKFGVFGGLVFQQYLTSSFKDVPAKVHPWRLDLEFGVRYFPFGW